MMAIIRTALVFVYITAITSSLLNAQILVEYDLATANAADSDTVDTLTVADNISASPMVSADAFFLPFDSPGTFCYIWTGPGLNPDEYYEFQITPDAGILIEYDTCDMSIASGSGGMLNFELRGSLDGFNSSDIFLDGGTFDADGTWKPFNGLDLSPLGTQSEAVDFRFYIYSNELPNFGFAGFGVAGKFGEDGQNFKVNGQVMTVCDSFLGDVDQNGEVDFLDIQPFVDLLNMPGSYQCEADINQDGVLNFLDIEPFVALL